jgi:phage tail-like protein
MPSRTPEPLLRVSSFEVTIGDRELGFAEISRLTSDTDLASPADRHLNVYAPVVLRRAVSSSTELYDWRRLIVDGKDDRRDVTIRQLSGPTGQVVNSWRLVRAWPSRWSGPAFNAQSNDVAMEELELTFDDLVWLESPGIRGG